MTCWSIVKCRYNAAQFIAILQCTSLIVSATNTFVQFHICVIKCKILCMVNISWSTYNDFRTVIYINIVSNRPRWTNLEDIWNGLKFYKKSISQNIAWSNAVILFGFQCPNQSMHVRHQAITSINADLLSILPLGTNFSEFWIKIQNFHSLTCIWKISSAKWRKICPGEDELTRLFHRVWYPCAVYFSSVIIHREMPMIKLITDNQQMEKNNVYPIE